MTALIEPTFAQGRELAWRVMRAALRAVDPAEAVRNALRLERDTPDGDVLTVGERRYRLADYRRVLVFGAGKASAPMARAVADVLGDRVAGGPVNATDGDTGATAAGR